MAKRTTSKATTNAIKTDPRELFPAWVSASVMPGEQQSSAFQNNTGRDLELAARAAMGTPAKAVSILASVCASQTLRLYRKAGSGSKRYATRAVTDRGTLAYLCGRKEAKPSRCKGANYAEKSGGQVEEVLSHPVLDVLQNPDPVYSGQVWMHLLWWFREACGRAYLFAGDRVGGDRGVPVSLYILPSCYTWPVKSTTGLIDHFVYARNRTSMMRIAPDDVVYLRHQADPFDPVGGMSWMRTVTHEADMEAAALAAEIARWKNGGMPGAVFEADPNTPNETMAQIRAGLLNQIRGVGKSGELLLLRSLKLVQYSTKPHEMQYIQGMEATEKRIYDAAGIPESIYRLNSANLASATVADGQFARLTIAPRLATMASELTELLLPLYGITPGEMWFAFDNPVRDDLIALATEYRAGEAQGLVTPNEWRGLLQLDPLDDDCNALRYRQTEAPAPAPAFGQVPTPEMPEPEDDPNEPPDETADGGSVDGTPESKSVHGVRGGCGDGGHQPAGVGVACHKSAAEPVRELIFKAYAWDEATGVPAPVAKVFTRFSNELTAWYTAAIPSMVDTSIPTDGYDLANGADIVAAAEAMTKPLGGEHIGKLTAITNKFTRDLMQSGVANTITQAQNAGIDVTFSTTDPAVAKYVMDRGLELATSVPETMKGTVREAIAGELEKGTSVTNMADAMTKAAPEIGGYQAERLARTESSMAFASGRIEGAIAAGAEGKVWFRGGGACPTCDALAAKYGDESKAIPIAEPFTVGETVLMNEPAHPNCRCATSIVFTMPENVGKP